MILAVTGMEGQTEQSLLRAIKVYLGVDVEERVWSEGASGKNLNDTCLLDNEETARPIIGNLKIQRCVQAGRDVR